MADLAIKKCCCCRQDINNIKHAVNLFGDKSFKEGIRGARAIWWYPR